MAESQPSGQPAPDPGGHFEPTRWTRVIQAAQEDSPESRKALESLCAIYWRPLYAYARRRGYPVEDAEDITQGFFCQVLEGQFLQRADRRKGKFRSFLLASLNYFLANRHDHDHAQKRDRRKLVFLDEKAAEQDYSLEPVTQESPEILFERTWARTVMEQARKRLRRLYLKMGKGELFDRLSGFLKEETQTGDYTALAEELGMRPNSVAVTVNRLRDRYRECIRAEVADTVGSAEEVEREMRHLQQVLAGE